MILASQREPKSTECRYATREIYKNPLEYCGARVVPGAEFCEKHLKIVLSQNRRPKLVKRSAVTTS